MKLALRAGAAEPSDLSENQYRFVLSLLASITRPVVALTVCLLPLTLFRFGEVTSRMTGVPRPEVNERLSIGDVFSKIEPTAPENGQPLSGAVANT